MSFIDILLRRRLNSNFYFCTFNWCFELKISIKLLNRLEKIDSTHVEFNLDQMSFIDILLRLRLNSNFDFEPRTWRLRKSLNLVGKDRHSTTTAGTQSDD